MAVFPLSLAPFDEAPAEITKWLFIVKLKLITGHKTDADTQKQLFTACSAASKHEMEVVFILFGWQTGYMCFSTDFTPFLSSGRTTNHLNTQFKYSFS